MKTKRRQRKPRLPRTDWFKAVALLAGKGDSDSNAAGSPAHSGQALRLADGSILASEGGECRMPPRG
jgi:hypothetical protein